MSRILLLALGVFVLIRVDCYAQEKMLSIEESVFGKHPERILKFNWLSSSTYCYEDEEGLIMQKVGSSKKSVLVNKTDLYSAIAEAGCEKPKYFPMIEWEDERFFHFYNDTHLLVYDLKSKEIALNKVFSQSAENLDFCYLNKALAYTIENNLFVSDIDNKSVQITNDDNKDIVNGQDVHRREFGIDGGTFWSPKGNFLAFYRKDESMVTNYPLVNITERIASEENIKYPMAGMKSHHVTLGIFNVSSGTVTFLKTGEPKEQYLTNVVWSPDEKYIYITILNRDQNHAKLNKYNIVTGELVKTLFEEKNERYVEPEEAPIFLKTKPNEFIWHSERDGYKHLYLYDTEGKLIKQLTKGDWIVTNVLGFDKEEKHLFFQSTQQSPIERHTYKVNLDTGEITQLTKTKGTHTSVLSPDGTYLFDAYSNLTTPRVSQIIDNSGEIVKNLLTSKNPYEGRAIPQAKIFTIKGGDGKTDLYCRLIQPNNLDPEKKYPAIIYVYGGPHAQLVTESWLGGSSLWQYYMAQKGYVMLTIDNRGSAGRGFEFESCIHRQVGTLEEQDQMKGVDYLKNLGYVDMKRLGVHGWSYGGFMTTGLMLHSNETFKVGVAGGPVINWEYYEIMYGERYMDTPQDNPDGYEKSCLLNDIDSLNGKLLLIHGGIDPVVVWQHSLVFVRECIKKGKQLDYFVYPRAEHNVGGLDRIHLMKKITQYFEDYL